MKKIKMIAASLTAVAMATASMMSMSASAADGYHDAYAEYKSGSPGSYRGVGVADGTEYQVISGYMNTSSGKAYAEGTTKLMTTNWVVSYATSATGVFTFAQGELTIIFPY